MDDRCDSGTASHLPRLWLGLDVQAQLVSPDAPGSPKDKNPSYPKAVVAIKSDGELWLRSRLRQIKYLNNNVKQDHRRIKRLTGPVRGFKRLATLRRTLPGFETMAITRKWQV